MKLKSFREFLQEYTVNKSLFLYKGFKINFAQKDDGDHSLKSRLSRANINRAEFESEIKKAVPKIKANVKQNSEQRKTFLLVFPKFQAIATYYKKGKTKYIQIVTILTKNMIAKDYDEKYLIEFFNIETTADFLSIKDKGTGFEIFFEKFEGDFEVLINNAIILKIA